MIVSDSFRKRKGLLFAVLFVVFTAFVADVFDLREELNILSSSYTDLDNTVAAGMIAEVAGAALPLTLTGFLLPGLSVEASVVHRLPCGLRAPPSQS